MTAPADPSPSTDEVDRWNTTSNILGYTYFLSWTLSFYPQIITNYLHPHKARHGVSLDFVVWNIVGFACYAVYVTCFRYSGVVREEYADRFGSGGATTETNDVAFAWHALILTIVTFVQIVWCSDSRSDRGDDGEMDGIVMVATEANITYWGGGEQWQWIDYLYFLSFVKVGVTTVKYIPQVVLNYQRKSTEGWQIWNILLDFSGGTLSIVQLIGDSMAEARVQGLQHDWTGVIGNPAKFGLGLVSILFDILFMFQHYALYQHSHLPSQRQQNGILNEHVSESNCNEEQESPRNVYETPLLSSNPVVFV
ncbi:hypothetical protein THAPSDRAFT_269820 [Thalassiosira pseudonana CCMP1335]|uniref:Cystinosin n=1 Tax=Thalassiosira pseudonana TaxID=35128 RepID=B8CD86_THAPS|nr:hypothetical protein THAPSDRAFT_269820 [Thalassiosira pseudonana CCMP1335]EED88424.1 hypothetical protein THAPSDRAFT_269820 [Thalassiosira pseudonana CCMP1335]